MNSNILLQKQNCFREQVSRVQIFTASKNFYFINKIIARAYCFFRKKSMDGDKKLNSVLRRHNGSQASTSTYFLSALVTSLRALSQNKARF